MTKESYTPEEIEKRFEALPPDIKSLVYGADMLTLLQKIGEKYKLHIDQIGVLEGETADVMTGFSKPEEFVKNISKSLSIDAAQAENIAKDINEGLFIKIRESMKKLSSQALTTPAQVPAPAPAVPVPVKITAPVAPPPSFVPKPVVPHPADMMLSQKTVTSAPLAPKPAVPPAPAAPKVAPPAAPKPPAPQPYKADPYREPTA